MTKRMIIMLVAVGVLFGGLFGFKAFLGGVIKKSISAQGVPPQTVSTAKAQFTEWQGEFQAVGTLRAVRGADIAPELSGVITAIHFQSGQAVAAAHRWFSSTPNRTWQGCSRLRRRPISRRPITSATRSSWNSRR